MAFVDEGSEGTETSSDKHVRQSALRSFEGLIVLRVLLCTGALFPRRKILPKQQGYYYLFQQRKNNVNEPRCALLFY